MSISEQDEKHEQGSSGRSLRGDLYSQCFISGTDIAAYLVDGSFDWAEMPKYLSMDKESQDVCNPEAIRNLLPVLDHCGMFLLFEKVCELITILLV